MYNNSEVANAFAKIPIFYNLPKEILDKLETISKTALYRKKDLIAIQGDQISNLIIVKTGMINLVFTNYLYEEIFFTSLTKNDPIGVFEILYEQNYSYSAKALTDCEVYEIPCSNFLQYASQNLQLKKNINDEIAALLNRSYDIIRESNTRIEQKILNTILFLAEEFGTFKSNIVEIKPIPSQVEIALMAGTTRETICRTFSSLQKEDRIIVDKSSIVIPDFEKFKKLTENFN